MHRFHKKASSFDNGVCDDMYKVVRQTKRLSTPSQVGFTTSEHCTPHLRVLSCLLTCHVHSWLFPIFGVILKRAFCITTCSSLPGYITGCLRTSTQPIQAGHSVKLYLWLAKDFSVVSGHYLDITDCDF